MPHNDTAYQERMVSPPIDLRSFTDAAGTLVFAGTCPVCLAANEFVLVDVSPGVVTKRLPWRRPPSAPTERRMDCECRVTHPEALEQLGCGAFWMVRPSAEGTA
ncbi:hypothetical protein ACIPJM_27800 [Streptomyces halstedii]|uniref:hypothetical protein n=1 Tax=Streptomyces halstedii TaxID=1944 RepID=UPI0037FD73E4